ncbi:MULTISPECIES: HAD hydrolase-like protein [unclassified Caballeronia]|uniref:HAD family hydrolase n=1 Tax=unclassified Caballeronia TaxID=2646786 RepID=UPI002857073C|nr:MULTISPECIES: HAD hydrolase-like protein [unclassified Caballeronia]MDR5751443.1 HAD hydrolase-like protein [Caballeronia sp. LZ024]MDR5844416.1 HAD hydrolase-like protein [Caballeronia sp. LZ031]
MSTVARPVIGFDLDGTLITCKAKQLSALGEALETCGVEYASYEQFWQLKRNGATTQAALVATGVEEGQARVVGEAWVECVETWRHMQQDAVFEGVLPLLQSLRGRVSLFLLSARREPDLFSREVASLGLAELFDSTEVVRSGKDAGRRKADRLREHKALCYFGDTESDMEAAALAGVPIYLVSTGQRSRSYLERAIGQSGGHAAVFDNLTCAIHEVESELLR